MCSDVCNNRFACLQSYSWFYTCVFKLKDSNSLRPHLRPHCSPLRSRQEQIRFWDPPVAVSSGTTVHNVAMPINTYGRHSTVFLGNAYKSVTFMEVSPWWEAVKWPVSMYIRKRRGPIKARSIASILDLRYACLAIDVGYSTVRQLAMRLRCSAV